MKTSRHRSIVYSVAALGLFTLACARPLFAESGLEAEWKQLRDQRDKELSAAASQINQRYQAGLEQLKRHATQAGDLELAVKAKDELESLQEAGPTTGNTSPLDANLTSKKWFFTWEDPSTRNYRGHFSKDHIWSEEWPPNHKEKWTVERKWVLSFGGSVFIPVDQNTLRGFFVPTGRQVALFAEQK